MFLKFEAKCNKLNAKNRKLKAIPYLLNLPNFVPNNNNFALIQLSFSRITQKWRIARKRFYAPAIWKMVERAYSVIPVRSSVSVRVRR